MLSYADIIYLLHASENKRVVDDFNIGSFIIAISFNNTAAWLDMQYESTGSSQYTSLIHEIYFKNRCIFIINMGHCIGVTSEHCTQERSAVMQL